MIGGAFWSMNHSRAIDVGVFAFLRFTKGLERYAFIRRLGVNNLVLVLIMLMFSIFGVIFRMSEGTIAFVIITTSDDKWENGIQLGQIIDKWRRNGRYLFLKHAQFW